ncbi:MAG TPA: portal protein [Aquabacterium sp.]|nr:portal protein [Aquabacterium sp.]
MSNEAATGDELAKDTDDAAIIAECMARMQISVTADSENRSEAIDDLNFKKGDQWDPAVKAQRTRDQRPCLTMNKLPTFVHQVTNAQRQNVPSINVHPVGNGDKDVAEVIQGGIRHVEYASNANVCYDTAVNSAAEIGFGYFRLVTAYCREDSFDQEIQFKRIRNPFTVYMDPAHVNPDGSDQQWCILSIKTPRAEFKAEYPDADPADMAAIRGLGDAAHDWADSDQVRLAEYYRIHREPAKVVLLSNGESGFKDKLLELPPGVTIKQERDSFRTTVQWFKLTATQIIDRADIPCKWIPVFPVYGDETDIDGKVFRSGLIRNAKDPARMYNFWMTAATEEVALRPKTPYIGAEGQFEGHESEWASANTSSFPFLEYKPKSLGGMLAPPPQRQPMADLPSGVLAMAMHASDDIKATTGIFDASLGARSNETSGVAIKQRDRQGDTANFHYIDNLHNTLRHVGRCIIDMWPKVYDAQRTLQIMGRDGKVSAVEINAPVPPEQQKPDPKTGAIQQVLNDMTVGEYSVTVSSGPSYDTMRQEAVDGMIQTAQSWPKLMEIAGDKVVRSMDWPMSDEIADRIEKTLAPELRDHEEGENGEPAGPPPLPPEVQQHIQQLEQGMDALMDKLEQANSGLEKARIDAQAKVEVAKINAESRGDVEELKGVIAMLLQKMQPPPILAADVAEDLQEDDTGPASAGLVASGGDGYRPDAGPASEPGAPGNDLPLGQNSGPEIAQ